MIQSRSDEGKCSLQNGFDVGLAPPTHPSGAHSCPIELRSRPARAFVGRCRPRQLARDEVGAGHSRARWERATVAHRHILAAMVDPLRRLHTGPVPNY